MKMHREKNRYVKNQLSVTVFVYMVILVLVGFTLVYEKYFLTFSMRDLWDYFKLYFTTLGIGIISYYFTFRFHRNVISIINIGIIPALFYDLVKIWRYEDTIKHLDIIGLVIVICISSVLADMYCCKFPKSKKQRQYLYEKIAFFTRIGVFVLLVASIYIGKKHIKEQYTLFYSQVLYHISESQDEIWDYDNSLSANIEEVSKLDPERGWRELSLEDKATVLETCVRVETRYYGIDQAPALRISHLEENLLGHYNPETNEVTISYEYLTVADGYSILRVIAHEMAHVYQHCMVNFFQDIKGSDQTKKYENLRLLY